MDAEDKKPTEQKPAEEPDVIPDRLFDGDKLVFNWDKCAFVILVLWCLQPVLTAAAQIYHPVSGSIVSSLSFYLIGICACIICLLYLLDRINYEKGVFFLRIWKHQRWNVFLFAMLVWGGIAALLADNINIALMGTAYRLDGYLSYCIYAGFFGCAVIIGNIKILIKILKYFVGISVLLGILSLIAIIPFFNNTPNIYCISLRYMRGTSMFSNINHYGYYLVMAIICAMGLFLYEKSRKKSAMWLVAALFNIWVLIDNNSFGCYIAVFVGLIALGFIFYTVKNKKIRSFIPIFAFILLSVCLSPLYNIGNNFFVLSNDISKLSDDSQDPAETGSGRWTLWVQTVDNIIKKPFFGYGPEGLTGKFTQKIIDKTGIKQTVTSFQDRPHNEYLQHAAFIGLPALIFYLTALVMLFVSRIKNIKNISVAVLIAGCAVIGYLISAFFGNTMYYTTPFFFMLLGIAAHLSHEESDLLQIKSRDAV